MPLEALIFDVDGMLAEIEEPHPAGAAAISTPGHFSSTYDFSRAASLLSDLGEPEKPCRRLAGPA
jgi:hypothetical protein